jgi:hypothetical protein
MNLFNREGREKTRGLVVGKDDAFPFETGIRVEIDQEPELEPGDLEVVQQLGPMLIGQRFGRFEFDDDFIKTKQVGGVGMLQWAFAIVNPVVSLCIERNA